jgi:hypothetical protein
MPGTPPPLRRGYDDADEDDLLTLLDEHDSKANDRNDPTVNTAIASALATAIARHEALKKDQDPDNYRPRLHERASAIAGGWRPR